MGKRSLIDEFIDAYDVLSITALTLMRDENDAMDLLQDLAELLIVKSDAIQDVKIPVAYFKTCLRHLKYNKIKKNAKEIIVDPDDMDSQGKHHQVDPGIAYMEIIQWLNHQLESSPPEIREAFIKYHIDGHPLDELAKELSTTTNTLSQRFSRMRKKLKQESVELYLVFIMFVLYQMRMR